MSWQSCAARGLGAGHGQGDTQSATTPEKLVEAVDELEDKVKAFKLKMVDREVGKEVGLGTSKINTISLGPGGRSCCAFPIFGRSGLIWFCLFPPSMRTITAG
jgi:hypothetical protein